MAPSQLPELPERFPETRDSLHRVAEKILAPARLAATGDEFSLEATEGGFGTPTFPDGGSVRVEINELVVDSISGQEARAPITTLKRAALMVGLDGEALDDVGLDIEEQPAAVLALAYHFADAVLGELRAELGDGKDPSEIRLWPEHFDIAFEMGIESEGRRAGYGLSPGDEHHPEPYLYVGPWATPEGAGWNAVGFPGAELGWGDLLRAGDPRGAALGFFRERFNALHGN